MRKEKVLNILDHIENNVHVMRMLVADTSESYKGRSMRKLIDTKLTECLKDSKKSLFKVGNIVLSNEN